MRSPTTMASAEAKPAPGEMPASIGSASGLRNRPCITVPPAASSAPIITASAMRGKPHRPQHELVARGERGVVALHKAERGGQAAQRNAGRADRCGNRRRRNERDDERADDQSG